MSNQIMTPRAPTPRLHGTMSAWEFTQHVIDAVESEPKRLLMDHVVTLVNGKGYGDYDDFPPVPECGTVCCIGGWCLALSGRLKDIRDTASLSLVLDMLAPLREDGPNSMRLELDACFYECPEWLPQSGGGEAEFKLGTPEYVAAAIKPFKAWREKYERELKERMVVCEG